MGLGLHGGGLAVARYLHDLEARVTVTDLRSPEELAPTIASLPRGIRLVPGEHRDEDFTRADLVVKNPAVPRTARHLRLARAVTTDIALFLAGWSARHGGVRGPLVGVTGTKGKSSTAGATAAILKSACPGTRLGGNITISPLLFLDALGRDDPVVLELSSFQLGDLRFCREFNDPESSDFPPEVLFPRLDAAVAMVTSIYPDHQDYYTSLESYVRDKEEILLNLRPGALCVLGCDERWNGHFAALLPPETVLKNLSPREEERAYRNILPRTLALKGAHMRRNLLMAALAARHLGVPAGTVRNAAASFRGVPHRLEWIGEREGVEIVNDTAATIPEAGLAAAETYRNPVILLAGGSDKGLDLAPLVQAGTVVARGGGRVVLLAGSATDRLIPLLKEASVPVHGPCGTLREGMERAVALAREARTPDRDETVTILLSPGCASFGMFRNEFDRGTQFRELAEDYLAGRPITREG